MWEVLAKQGRGNLTPNIMGSTVDVCMECFLLAFEGKWAKKCDQNSAADSTVEAKHQVSQQISEKGCP